MTRWKYAPAVRRSILVHALAPVVRGRGATVAAFVAAIVILDGCDAGRSPAPTTSAPSVVPRDAPLPVAVELDAATPADAARPDLDAFDLDGDGTADQIGGSFTGGAHCCYTIGVKTSRAGKAFTFPFELDGGYTRGLDLSQPAHFNIADYDGDGLVEICAEIGTYNNEPARIPAAWRKPWGFKTHVVEIGFKGGKPTVRDHGSASCATP
jgi:hypothetical protein